MLKSFAFAALSGALTMTIILATAMQGQALIA